MEKTIISQEWKVETLRLTGFPTEIVKQPEQEQWWFSLTGEQPANRLQNPRQAILQEDGPFKNANLIVKIEPLRVDLLYTTTVLPLLDQSDEIPCIGSFQDILNDFNSIVSKLLQLPSFPLLGRLAFGSTLIEAVSNKKEGYDRLATFLRFPIDSENSSDFFYQINRPRLSDIITPKIIINRLSKWSVASHQTVALQIKPEPKTFSPTNLRHAVRLEVDINTSQDFAKPLPKEKLIILFNQLVDYAVEISKEGDIK
jgi:hypothetical protein